MKKEKLTKFSDYVYYYKWHAIIAVVVIVVLAFTIHDCATKIEDDMVVTALLSNYPAIEASENMSADFVSAGLIPDANEDGVSQVYVNLVTVPLDPQSEQEMMGAQQAMIAMAADDSILFLIDEDLLEMYETQGAFGDISEKAESLGYGEDLIYTAEDGTVMGISLKDNEYLKSKGVVTDTLYACYRALPEGELEPEAKLKLKAADDIFDYIMK